MEFDYNGKTAVEALLGLCAKRQFPQPMFLDKSSTNSDRITVTVIVGDRAYGTGEGDTSALACEQASLVTLSAWLKDDFRPDLLCPVGCTRPDDIAAAGDGAQTNALSLFNLYVSGVARDVASKPDFNVVQGDLVDPKFKCVLTITIDSKVYRSEGEGRTKVVAKRIASYMLLRHIYPSCTTLHDLSNAVDNDIILRRKSKKNTKVSLPPPFLPSGLPSAQVGCMDHPLPSSDTGALHSGLDEKWRPSPFSALPPQPAVASDELSRAVDRIAHNAQQEYGIKVPSGYTLRQASADDAVTIMALVKELAEYEKAPDSVKLSAETLARDGWGVGLRAADFRPYFYVYLVDYVEAGAPDTVGMALFFPVYSTWEGKFLYLEDLYVKEAHRAKGIGCALMRTVGAVAMALDIPRYQWQCLSWNEKPLQFYASTGAKDMADWKTLRLEGVADIARFVREGTYPKFAQGAACKQDCDEDTDADAVLYTIDGVNGGSASAGVDSGGSWFDRFKEAREVATESDKCLIDFAPSTNRGKDDSLRGEEEQDVAGGFCQPKDLAAFVNASIKTSAAMSGRYNTCARTCQKRIMEGDKITYDANSQQGSSCSSNSSRDFVVAEERAHRPYGSGYTWCDVEERLKGQNISKRSRK